MKTAKATLGMKGAINTTTAYELSRLAEDKQKETLADLQGGGKPSRPKQSRRYFPCPFCGCTEIVLVNYTTNYRYECTNGACGVQMGDAPNLQAAISRWNKRAHTGGGSSV